MCNMIRTASMLVLMLGVCVLTASLGCSQPGSEPAPPAGAPDGDMAVPKVETPAADAPAEGAESDADQEKKAEPAGEMPADESKAEAAKPEAEKEDAEKPAAKTEEKAMPAKEEPAKEPAAEKPAAEKPANAEKPAKEEASAKEKKDVEKVASAPKKPAAETAAKAEAKETVSGDWNQWAGSSARNNTPVGKGIATEWEPGEFDDETGEWQKDTAKNIKWVARLGSQSYGNPVVASGKVFVGTNNGAGWLKRYPATVDLGCLLCFNEADGKFLWQASSEKLPTGRVHDWPLQGICCAPLVEGDRLWYVTSRGEIVCLDVEGFHDGENDGPNKAEPNENKDEADVVWLVDMMGQLKVSQHNMCSCSITSAGDMLFVNTSNGVDEGHTTIPSPAAPSFLAVDKNTGKILWQDDSPGNNILHGQWSSPAYAVLGGVPQVLFGGGDGWLRSFRGEATEDGKPELLWEFDCNPKDAKYSVSGRSTRNHIIGTPVVYEGLVYIAVGEDPEHGEGNGHLWCIDPTKRGDVSSELAVKVDDREHPLPHRRLQAIHPEDGEIAVANPNSAAIWHYVGKDLNGDGELKDFEEQMHRTCGTAVIKNGLLFIPDFSGLMHCLDAKTGEAHWTHDLFAATWGSAMIVEDKVYVGDEEGKVTIFKLSPEKEILAEVEMGNSVYSTPIVAHNTLFIANKTHLFAITPEGEEKAADAGQPAKTEKVADAD
ncbi:MAG TPA: PQQ-binding-like beta-propeller repeat protein [Pirellulales bacterium]|jgi:outer membrane protein assembly factor BamB|nr:PQQ-binding-like beta-propeller repeat protein [Pirellulales bacterium]